MSKFRAILVVVLGQLINLHLGDFMRSKFGPGVTEGLHLSFTYEQWDLN